MFLKLNTMAAMTPACLSDATEDSQIYPKFHPKKLGTKTTKTPTDAENQ